MGDQDDQRIGLVRVPVEFVVPSDVKTSFADRILIQHSEHEFIISFFETEHPILLGTPEENEERLRSVSAVKANCVARIVIAAGRMPEMVEALVRNLDHYRTKEGKGDGY